ncbi:MAG: hypothetical protein ACE10C_11920 [Candidatus Binatia bacterium]
MQLAMTFKQLKQQVELSSTILTIAVYLFFLADIVKKLGNTTIAAGIGL